MFTAALFTVAKIWKKPVFINRLMDKDAVHTYNGLLFSHKKNGMMPFSPTWRDLEIGLSEVSQTEKDK